MGENLDPVSEAGQCAQNVNDIAAAKNSPERLINLSWTVFECFENAESKLSMAKRHFGRKKVDFHGRTITPTGVIPKKKLTKF